MPFNKDDVSKIHHVWIATEDGIEHRAAVEYPENFKRGYTQHIFGMWEQNDYDLVIVTFPGECENLAMIQRFYEYHRRQLERTS